MSRRGKPGRKPSSDAFYLTMMCLSFMGMATVFVRDATTPDARTGQRLVRQQAASQAKAAVRADEGAAKPVRLWKDEEPKEVDLASLAPQCQTHDWACVAWAANDPSYVPYKAKRGRK